MLHRRRFVELGAAAALAPALPCVAQAQSPPQPWPARIVRLIVPFVPGGGTDSVGRVLAQRLSERWGQQMVIENKGGAGSNIGSEHVARSEPDGYTVLFGSLPLAVNRFIYPSLGYDAFTDFAPVTLLAVYPNLMIVPNSSPVKSVKEFIDHAKANPGKISYGSSGTGTSTHLAGELFKRMAGIEMTHVPYRGVSSALNDLIPGRLDVMFNTAGGTLMQARAGQVRGLAVTSAKRFPTAAEYPTIAESGVPGFDVSAWYALFVPAKTPPAIIRKLNADTLAVLAEPAVKERLTALGLVIVGSTPEELGRHFKAESELWAPVIKAAGIKADG
jgi:tripartite-type tricarboxylate transporter receptor subunit TctC